MTVNELQWLRKCRNRFAWIQTYITASLDIPEHVKSEFTEFREQLNDYVRQCDILPPDKQGA